MLTASKIHPNDVGLSARAIRKRRRSRRLAWLMLAIAIATAIAGWALFGSSIFSAIRIKDQPPSLAIVAYALLIISSTTLVLGLWYLLLAQVERLAHIVESDDADHSHDSSGPRHCGNCGWPIDPPDLFCRHCGRPLGTSINPNSEA